MTSQPLSLTDPLRREAIEAAGRLSGERVVDLVAVSLGRNSLIAKVSTQSGKVYALKRHRRDEGDPRDRIGSETAALTFLHERGIACAPTVVARDAEWLLMDWIEAGPVAPAGNNDIDQAIDLVDALAKSARHPSARGLPLASEACFSGNSVLEQIEARHARLSALPDEPDLARFLQDFSRASIIMVTEARLTLPFAAEIAQDERTLSPSDFGFHNALRRPDGGLVFIDFEYFGWDDPVKLTADFLLHPGMALAAPLKHRFAAGMAQIFQENRQFLNRFQYLLPLYGLRWCMILLNEFIPGKEAAWSGASAEARQRRKTEQLNKAWAMLSAAIKDHEDFPYEP